jgi:transcriptional antiterminator RfaH
VPFWTAAQLQPQPQREHLALHCLHQSGFEVYAPRLRERRTVHGRAVVRTPLLFPGYVFVFVQLQWHAARWSFGVARLVMNGAAPAAVPLIAEIKARERNGVVALPALQPGDRVTVTRGPLCGLEGLYAGQAPHERVAVLLSLLGGQQRVTLPRDDVEALVR